MLVILTTEKREREGSLFLCQSKKKEKEAEEGKNTHAMHLSRILTEHIFSLNVREKFVKNDHKQKNDYGTQIMIIAIHFESLRELLFRTNKNQD
jgi:hypothetical protein